MKMESLVKFYFKCVSCHQKGVVGNSLQPDKDFFSEGWYIDTNKTKHQIIICNKCGTLHDVYPSLLKFPLLLLTFGKIKIVPFVTNGYYLLSDLYTDIERNKDDLNSREVLHYGYNLNDKIISYMVDKGFLDKNATQQIRITYEIFLEKFKKTEQ